jgi:pimeloyl-ACP methyl ester carboxylesterase
MKSAIVSLALMIACAGAKPVPESLEGLRISDGGSGGVPVVFLHGLCGDLDGWSAQIEHLRGTRRVVAYDQRGHGHSARSDQYTVDLLAGDLDTLSGALNLGKFWLVGHSMSGAVLSAYAGKHPEKLAGLVFVDALGDLSGAPEEMKNWFRDAPPGLDVPRMKIMFGEMLGDKAKPATREKVLASTEKCDPRAFVQLRQEVIARSPAAVVAKFAGPKLAIEAEGPDNPYLASKLPGVKRRTIPNVSHWLMLDDPGALNAALDEALK